MKTYTIGRGAAADIKLSAASVSRRHAELTVTDEQEMFIVDCASSAGTTRLEGQEWRPLKQAFVKRGDRLRFGDQEMEVRELLNQLG